MNLLAPRKISPALCVLLLTAALSAALFAGPGAALPPPIPVPGAAFDLSNPYNESNEMEIVYGPTGDGIAVWTEQNASTYTVWSARDNATVGWGAPTFHFASGYNTANVKVGMDPAGTASFTWINATTPGELWYARSYADGSASAPVRLHTANTMFAYGQIAMEVGPTGSMFVFWSEAGSSTSWAVVVDAAGAIDGPVRVDGGSTAVFEKVLAPDPVGGKATALACDRSGSVANLTESIYAPGAGWTAPVVVAPNLSNGCSYMDGGIDGAGNINLVVYGSLNKTLLLLQRPAGGSWSGPQPFYGPLGGARLQSIEVDVQAGGTLLLAWTTQEGSIMPLTSAFVGSWDPASGWTAPVRVANNVTANVRVELASTSGGSGLVLFSPPANSTYTQSVAQFTRMVGCGAWSVPVDAGVGSSNYNYMAAALKPEGWGHILYQIYNGAHWAARAAPVSLNLPAPLRVSAPLPGSTTTNSVEVFAGTMQPGSTVSVGGATQVTGGDGAFSLPVPLHAGTNNVTVVGSFGTTWAGCGNEVTVSIEYQDPLPQLLIDFAEARAELNATMAALAAAEASGNATQADLDEAKADLAAAQALLDSTSQELARVKVQFPWLESNLTAAQGDLAGARADIVRLEAEHNATAASNRALSGQVGTLSLVAFVALIAAVASMVLSIVRARGGVARVKDPAPAKGGADAEKAEPSEAREPTETKDRDR